MSKVKKSIYLLITMTLLVVIGYSAYQVEKSNQEYVKEKKVREEVMEYKPVSLTSNQDTHNSEIEIVNQSILDLQEKNADTIGWLTIPGTQIDYPFLWADDYDIYLRTDINGESSMAGSIFMDYRCDRNLLGAHSILFGHNMNNGSMFGALIEFRDRTFFQEHQEGYIYLSNANIKLQIIACIVTTSSNAEVYGVAETEEQKERFLEVIKEENIHGREGIPEDLSIDDRFVLLSTCSYEHDEARTVVVYRIVG